MLDYKTIYLVVFFPAIFFLGIFTTIGDLRMHKIKNSYVFAALLYSLCVYAAALLCSEGIAKQFISNPDVTYVVSVILWHFDKWLINLTVCTIVAFGLCYYKLWGAGDGKLFIGYAALIPIGQYSKVYFHYYFASFFLLVLIFVPPTIFFGARSIFAFLKNNPVKSLFLGNILARVMQKIRRFPLREATRALFSFFVLFLALSVLRSTYQSSFSATSSAFAQNIFIFAVYLGFPRLWKTFIKYTNPFIIIFLLLVGFASSGLVNFNLVINTHSVASSLRATLVMCTFPFVKRIFDFYEERLFIKNTPFAHWMFFGALLTWFWQ